MPLAYEVLKELKFPDGAFNKDDIATILVTGGSYSAGYWKMTAIPLADSAPDELIGQIMTEQDERPDMAVDTVVVWVNDACVKAGLKVAHFENKNSVYGPDKAPFFATAIFLIDRRK